MPRPRKTKEKVERRPNTLSLRILTQIHSELKTLISSRERDISPRIVFEDPTSVDEEMTEQYQETVNAMNWVNKADQVFARIDASIYKAKADCGINIFISEDARFKRLLARVEECIRHKPNKGRDKVKDSLEKKIKLLQGGESQSFRGYDIPSINTSIWSVQEYNDMRSQVRGLKTAIRSMKDKLLQKNVSTLVELYKEDWDFLLKEALISGEEE
jgi:hypothetical protein